MAASASAWEYSFGAAVGCTVVVGAGFAGGCWLVHPLMITIALRAITIKRTIHILPFMYVHPSGMAEYLWFIKKS
jgi:hypothetical protein